MNKEYTQSKYYYVGLDIGSTTVKLAVLDSSTSTVVHTAYVRHGARQVDTAAKLCRELHTLYPEGIFKIAICGSGGRDLAQTLDVPFIQEVVANSIAIRELYPQSRTAIELGGQDAKIIFFHHDERGNLQASDMRMNGVCAGGTGAFIDEVSKLLNLPVEEFDSSASLGKSVHDISGRCGVFAKTDIQPLLNQGASKADLALSTFHAIAKQTIGGLAQGLEIQQPVIFVGGPLFFNKTLIRVFGERLNLNKNTMIVPDNPQILVALGAALYLKTQKCREIKLPDLLGQFANVEESRQDKGRKGQEFFTNKEEMDEFYKRHAKLQIKPQFPLVPYIDKPQTIPVFIGLDGGSTTSKYAVLSEAGEVLCTGYSHNKGKPLDVMTGLLIKMHDDLLQRGINPIVRGLGTTGYAEQLMAAAYHADYHTVETVAHASAARHYIPDVSFLLDIGGQDMKAIFLEGDVVTGIVLNEACSAGCGSFLENFASSLAIPVEEIAKRAFTAVAPSILGSRCTVFMNSSIISEQRNGKTPDEIMAGLCRSVIENVFTKVLRLPNLASLGKKIVVQGGTFRNDAVLRAMEQYMEAPVIRAPYPGEMGAIGIALLTMQKSSVEKPSTFIGFEELKTFTYSQKSGIVCTLCTNNCSRTIVQFSDNSYHVTGNRCERGETVIDKNEKSKKPEGKKNTTGKNPVPIFNVVRERDSLLFKDWPYTPVSPPKDFTIGIPRVLEFWDSFPFWKALFKGLGFEVVLSDRSTQALFQDGLVSVPSDTVCFPAKLSHGHVKNLVQKKVSCIFMPMQNRMPSENASSTGTHVCAVVKGYPLVIAYSDDPMGRAGIPFYNPMFHWFDEHSRNMQLCDWFSRVFGLVEDVVQKAIVGADAAQSAFRNALQMRGQEVLATLSNNKEVPFAVVIAGRPYHGDFLVNHDIDKIFVRQGIPVLPLDALSDIQDFDVSQLRVETTTPFHTRMYAAALAVAKDPRLELVQLVSFGCGHDAVISDEVRRLLFDVSGKICLSLKLDESSVAGPLQIRIRSFIETVITRRARNLPHKRQALKDPYEVKFTKKDKKEKTILIPNVSESFSLMVASAIAGEGYRVDVLPMADRTAIELGKKYVHNDMCYPAQINIGEMLSALQSNRFDTSKVACGLAKSECDCRLAHYAALARTALDDAGYSHVPIITTDKDNKGMHPAFSLGIKFQVRAMWGINMADALEHIRRRLRPYELVKGQTEEIFHQSVHSIARALRHSIKKAVQIFDAAIDNFAAMPAKLTERKPRVFIIGEFLLNFHAASNNFLEKYLENQGMEVVLPDAFAPMHRDFIKKRAESRSFYVKYPFLEVFANNVSIELVNICKKGIAKRLKRLPFMEVPLSLVDLASMGEQVVDRTFTPGEGWLISAEILHNAEMGINNFIIVQPFGCMPNHVVGRGIIKRLKTLKPGIQILPLDFDPDTSEANIENRLQMLIINAKAGIVPEEEKEEQSLANCASSELSDTQSPAHHCPCKSVLDA